MQETSEGTADGAGRRDPASMVGRARLEPGECLGELLDGYRGYLRILSRAALPPELRTKVDASDVVQETLLRAFDRFPQFRGATEMELTAWLRRILVRSVADVVRRYRGAKARDLHRERRLQETVDGSSRVLGDFLAASVTGPSGRASRRELAVAVANALGELSEDHREVLILRHIEGLDWPEIASRMGRSRKAVGMLWTRALASIRPLLCEWHGR